MSRVRSREAPASFKGAASWFTSPVMAGFECTTYVRRDGVRLDVQAATRHDRLAEADYRLVRQHGMHCVRDGLVWHRIEPSAGCYDWSGFDDMVDAAANAGVRVMWDLLHFGWPDWTHPLHDSFAERFAELTARVVDRIGPNDAIVPVNEISFLAWAAGEDGFMHPHLVGQGNQMKQALCAAFIASARIIREVAPSCSIMCAEPLIAVHPEGPEHVHAALAAQEAQFEALDIILGRASPELGGDEALVDVVGLNHYPHSQWTYPARQPVPSPTELSVLLLDVQQRYRRPLFLAETGCEGDDRADWFAHVTRQIDAANATGADVRSICLYPILNHLGWEDDRYCANGLYCGVGNCRVIHQPLADAIERWAARARALDEHASIPVMIDADAIAIDALADQSVKPKRILADCEVQPA